MNPYWQLPNEQYIRLLTIAEYQELPLGTRLFSIFGEPVTKSEDSHRSSSANFIDDDVRGGKMAYGIVVEPDNSIPR